MRMRLITVSLTILGTTATLLLTNCSSSGDYTFRPGPGMRPGGNFGPNPTPC